MVAAILPTPARPEARTFRVEELLGFAASGRIRVPSFQRAFKWDRDDVRKLLDSIWRGYPIGTLLLWSKIGPAGPVALGDLTIEVNEQTSAWFVVDGQQRIVSLVSTLRQRWDKRSDKFELYFDLLKAEIVPAPRGGPPATHLPLDRVVDSEDLLAWADEDRAALTPEQVRLAFRVGKELGQYELPAYVVSVEDEQIVREIFERTNATGKSLGVADVFNALHTPMGRQPAMSLKDVAERLRVRSFGDIDEDQVLRSLLAIEGRDLAGDLQRQLTDVDIPAAVERTERAMDRVFGFLTQDAGIPHLRLLPYQRPLVVLSAFFDRFPTPSQRARQLLTRWLWRGAATGELRGHGRGMRPALEQVRDARFDESAAQGVLSTVAVQRPELTSADAFNLRHARSRLSVIALAELRPHDLRTGELIDVTALLNGPGEIVPQLMTHRPAALPDDQTAIFSSVGNRVLHPAGGEPTVLTTLLDAVPKQGELLAARLIAPHVLASHAILPTALAALQRDDRVGFLTIRRDQVEQATIHLIDRHAEWGHSARTSIASMIDEDD